MRPSLSIHISKSGGRGEDGGGKGFACAEYWATEWEAVDQRFKPRGKPQGRGAGRGDACKRMHFFHSLQHAQAKEEGDGDGRGRRGWREGGPTLIKRRQVMEKTMIEGREAPPTHHPLRTSPLQCVSLPLSSSLCPSRNVVSYT